MAVDIYIICSKVPVCLEHPVDNLAETANGSIYHMHSSTSFMLIVPAVSAVRLCVKQTGAFGVKADAPLCVVQMKLPSTWHPYEKPARSRSPCTIKINRLVIGLEIFFFSIRELFTDSNQHLVGISVAWEHQPMLPLWIMPLAKCQQEPGTCPSREYKGAQLNTQHLTFTYSLNTHAAS